MDYQYILIDVKDRIATVTINRPEYSNAFARESYYEIADAMNTLGARDDVGVIVITGAGKHFSAGGDIKRFKMLVDTKTYLKAEDIEAAKSANAHEFITKLPEGYNTKVGEGGISLSGGEKQRISIARAIIQKPNILILDEATASMDTRTERKIQAAIDNLKQGRTIISIAHRLSTLRDADMLCVIENGELKEMGTHDKLIKEKGKYFELYKLQSEALQFINE